MLVTVPRCLARRLVRSERKKQLRPKTDRRLAAADQRHQSAGPTASSSDNLCELIIGWLGCVFVVDMTKRNKKTDYGRKNLSLATSASQKGAF